MRSNNFRNGSFKLALGVVVILIGAGSALAQTNPKDEYEEWQKAKREEAREHKEYLKNPKQQNYLDWRSAQRDANREFEEYKLALEVSGGAYRGIVAGNRNGRIINGVNRRVIVVGDVENAADEREDYEAARREVARERREFVTHPTDDNYLGWKEAQADAVREYAEYKVAVAPIRPVYITRGSVVTRRVAARRIKAKARRARICHCR